MRRGPGELQIGVDPRHAVVVGELPEAFVDELLALDGRHTVAELGERVRERGEDPAELMSVLAHLDEAGVLDRPRPSAPPGIAVHGEGELAETIRALLGEPPAKPELTIVTGFPAPEVVARLMHDRTPHLAVRAREGVGVVGPLVLPGRTSCLTCADLHRTDRDPCWPAIAAQLVARKPPEDKILATATAALSVTQALLIVDFVRGGRTRPPTWNAALELHPASGECSQRSWQPHPDCACSAHNMTW
ncbi:thiamin biosynthesis protein [Lentzea sp. NBRC 105346]|nr:thiamin biosynthesis protein [Lentzea sp. NBRC 105346]